VTIGRSAAAVTGGAGREFATDLVLTAVWQYNDTATGCVGPYRCVLHVSLRIGLLVR